MTAGLENGVDDGRLDALHFASFGFSLGVGCPAMRRSGGPCPCPAVGRLDGCHLVGVVLVES